MKKNIAYIISSINKSIAFEWIVNHIDTSKFNLTFILLNDIYSPFEDFLLKKNIPTFRINYNEKKDIPSAIFNTIKLLKSNKIEIVHCHLFEACLVGLTAAKLVGIKKRIHTRHNATIHHDYFPKAVKYDKFINYLSTDIIAISENVKNILIEMEHVNPKKIYIIHHGFDFNYFENISQERIDDVIKRHFSGIKPTHPTIGVISRYIHWKGIQYIIPAFIEFNRKLPKSHFIFASASGPYNDEIKRLLKQLPSKSYTEIKFEQDIAALYKLFDCFVHAPIDEKSEAFGQIYVEAMAAEVPCIVTKSGIANEYVEDKKNAIVVPFKNSSSIYRALNLLFSDNELKDKLILNAKNDVKERFGIEKMIEKLEELYGK